MRGLILLLASLVLASKTIPPPETEGLERLSSGCRNAILKVDQQVAQWIEQSIQRMTPRERRETDLAFLRRRIITVGGDQPPKLGVHFSNPSATFAPPKKDSEKNFVKISQKLGQSCPEVDTFLLSSSASYLRWTMRRTNFQVLYSRWRVYVDKNALMGFEKCRETEMDELISEGFSPTYLDPRIQALYPEELDLFDAYGSFLELPVGGILARGCQSIDFPDGTTSCYYGPVRGVIFKAPFATVEKRLQAMGLLSNRHRLVPDPTNRNQTIWLCQR